MPMHVLHLVRPADGGIREHVRELIWGLPHGKVRTTVASSEQSALFGQLPSWVKKHSVPMFDGIHPLRDIGSILALRDLLDRQSVDILHMHGAKSALIGRLAALAAHRKPRLICTFHNFVEPTHPVLNFGYRHLEQRLSMHTDRYIAVSNALALQLQQRLSIQPEQIATIYNGLSPIKKQLSKKVARTRLQLPENAIAIGTIARLIPDKGIGDLIQAFRLIRKQGYDVWLVIIGEGPQRIELQRSASDMAERIRWTGALENASELLKGLDIYIQSSYKEGFGLAVLEAMWSGIPVIATQTGGLPEVVGEADKYGVLVPVNNPDQLSQNLLTLLRDEGLRQQMAEAGQRRVKERFSADRMVNDTLDVYQNVLSYRRMRK